MRSHLHAAASATASLSILLALPACDKLTPNGQSNTLTLLKAGSERVCVDPAVQKMLRTLILPKPVPGSSDADKKQLSDTAADFNIDLLLTTLQSADKTVNRVTCNTTARMTELNGEEHSVSITYDISPSAERTGDIVVSGNLGEARTFANDAIANMIAHQNAAEAQNKAAEEAELAHTQLLALVKPRWLVGTWIQTTQPGADCGNGHAVTFQADHGYTSGQAHGQWALTGDSLHLVGQGASPADVAGTISAADTVSFTLSSSDNKPETFRRCTRAEISDTALPDMVAPPEATPN